MVNKKCLDYTKENDSCMILNAQIHYNHAYHHSIIGLDFRDRCAAITEYCATKRGANFLKT